MTAFRLHTAKNNKAQRMISIQAVVPPGYVLQPESVQWGSPPHADDLVVIQPQIDGSTKVITAGLGTQGEFDLNFYAKAVHPNAGAVMLQGSCKIEVVPLPESEPNREVEVSLSAGTETDIHEEEF